MQFENFFHLLQTGMVGRCYQASVSICFKAAPYKSLLRDLADQFLRDKDLPRFRFAVVAPGTIFTGG